MTEHKKHHKEGSSHSAQPADLAQAAAVASAAEFQAELDKANALAAEYLEGWKRAQAELANYRKRVERDAADVQVNAAGRSATRWFPILDDFARALRESVTAENVGSWKAGMELIYRKGVAALEAEGITPIAEEAGAAFDPNRHEAITMEPCPDREDGEILEVVRNGYRQGDRVLRPAQVRVASKPERNSSAGEG